MYSKVSDSSQYQNEKKLTSEKSHELTFISSEPRQKSFSQGKIRNFKKKTPKMEEKLGLAIKHFQENATENMNLAIDCSCFSMSSEGKLMFIGTRQGKMFIYDNEKKIILTTKSFGDSLIRKIDYSSGQNLFCLLHDSHISLIELNSNYKLKLRKNIKTSEILTFFLSHKELFLVSNNGKIAKVDFQDFSIEEVFTEDLKLSSVAFSSNRSMMALGCENGEVKIIDLKNYCKTRSFFLNNKKKITAISSADFREIFLAGDSEGNLFILKDFDEKLERFYQNQAGISDIFFSSKERFAFVARDDGKLEVWDLNTRKEHQILEVSRYCIESISCIFEKIIEDLKEPEREKLNFFIREDIQNTRIYCLVNQDIVVCPVFYYQSPEVLILEEKIEENCSLLTDQRKIYLIQKNSYYLLEISENYPKTLKAFEFHEENLGIITTFSFKGNKKILVIHRNNSKEISENFDQIVEKLEKESNNLVTEINSLKLKAVFSSKVFLFLISEDKCTVYENTKRLTSFSIISDFFHLFSCTAFNETRKIFFAVSQTKGIFSWELSEKDLKVHHRKSNKNTVKNANFIENKQLLVILYHTEKSNSKKNLLELWETLKGNLLNSMKLINVRNFLINREKWLVCLMQDSISVYSVHDFVQHFSIKIPENPINFCCYQGKEIIITYSKELIFYTLFFNDKKKSQNNLACNKRIIGNYEEIDKIYKKINKTIIGTNEEIHKIYKKINKVTESSADTSKKLKKEASVVKNRLSTSWILEPDHINEVHIYAYLNDFRRLEKALQRGAGFFVSSEGFSPLDICLKMKYEESFCVIFSFLKETRRKNPLIFSIIENSLIELIDSQLKSSAKLFKLFFCKSLDQTLPKFYSNEVNFLGKIKKSTFAFETSSLFPTSDKLQRFRYELVGNKIKFKQTYFKICMNRGSDESLLFLTRVIHNEKNIFGDKLDFISHVLDQKWKRVKMASAMMTVLYFTYFVLINLYNVYKIKNLLYTAFAINQIFLVNEILQINALRIRHFMVGWAVINISNIILTSILFFSTVSGYQSSEYLEIFTLYTAWHKGYSYFRLSNATGFYVNLIKWLFVDIFGFLIIFLFVTVGVAVLANAVYEFESFFEAFRFAWELNIGQFDTKDFRGLMYVVFVIGTLLCLMILLNMLIAIMTNTYQNLSNQIRTSECKEFALIIREAECLFHFFNKNKNFCQFIHKAESDVKLLPKNHSDEFIFKQKFKSLKKDLKTKKKNQEVDRKK